MKHLFEVGVAEEYGINAAVLLENICYWTKYNEANNINFFDGCYWTFNSRKALKEQFPYLSERQIGTALEKLINDGLIIKGNYNKLPYDRTLWYALTDKGKTLLHFCQMENTFLSNGNYKNVSPIPNINTDINTNNKEIHKESRKDLETEFNDLWALYPRKIGKQNALKSYITARQNGSTYQEVKDGILAYAEYIKKNKTGEKYIKHGSTWFNQKGWLDEYGDKAPEMDEDTKELLRFMNGGE